MISPGSLIRRARLALHLRLAPSHLYGPSFSGLARGTPLIALTYDDGPSDPWTFDLIDLFDRAGVSATFFLVGKRVAAHPEIALALIHAGHAIGNHTFSHLDLTALSPDRICDELISANRTIEDATGVTPTLFRPPFGRRNRQVCAIAADCGLAPVMWRAACCDRMATSAGQIVDTLMPIIKGGEVVRLHDGDPRDPHADRSHCVNATREMLLLLRVRGYRFVTVSQMMRAVEQRQPAPA